MNAPHLPGTPAIAAFEHLASEIATHAGTLNPAQVEFLVARLKDARFMTAADAPTSGAMGGTKERRSPHRYRPRLVIRKALRQGLIAIQRRIFRREAPQSFPPSLEAFAREMDGIQNRRSLARLEWRAYGLSWLSRGAALLVFALVAVLVLLYPSPDVTWGIRASVLMGIIAAILVSDMLNSAAFRLCALRERRYQLACVDRARTIDELRLTGLLPVSTAPDAQEAATRLSDALYRRSR
jgi:hypothetical protein